jgi:hypothetical protein
MIQVAFEDHQIRTRQVQEEVGSLRVKVPERMTRAPKGVLFIEPFTFAFVLLDGHDLSAPFEGDI